MPDDQESQKRFNTGNTPYFSKDIVVASDKLSIKVVSAVLIFFSFFVFSSSAHPQGKPQPCVKELSLQESILLAIRNNITIKSAYLDRITQKFDLKVAEDKFVPKLTLTPSVKRSSSTTTTTTEKTVIATVTEAIPTGATISLTSSNAFNTTKTTETKWDSEWDITLAQPLLKGAGFDVATASVRTARINEQINILSLKSTLIDTITSVISAYRTFLQAVKQVEISKKSLERAKAFVAVNKELIAAGRMAAVELVQTKADVASKEFDLLQTENSTDAARLSLIKLLDIDKHTMIVPVEKIVIEPVTLDYEQFKALAFQNRPDYLTSLLSIETSKTSLMLAKNNKLWDLSLTASYGESHTKQGAPGTDSDEKTWSGGLELTIPFRDLTLKQGYLSAKISLDKTELNHNKLCDNIKIEVQDAVRDIEMKLRQVKLAEQSRMLSEQKLSIETEKMKVGRSSNFQLVTFQNDLVNAQNSELNAIINYLNSVAALEKTLGTTLEKWGIKIEQRYEKDYLN